jgi:hypothetical protein
MAKSPIDRQTWRTFEWAAVKRFAWDACREVVLNGSYNEPWTFQDFLTVSKRMAYKSDDRSTVDSFFNNKNIYRPFLEEIIKEVVFWGFFSSSSGTNNVTEIEEACIFAHSNPTIIVAVRTYSPLLSFSKMGGSHQLTFSFVILCIGVYLYDDETIIGLSPYGRL